MSAAAAMSCDDLPPGEEPARPRPLALERLRALFTAAAAAAGSTTLKPVGVETP